ncbi:uncharacterized protein LOC111607635 [Xiphophorus maculatus]|uniref:uncharacterized protein LOC111607635 n=1 Tax=Xiphophorus maculatus TaxID=8083 RepID=UPI000C6E4511|nr:uncharacterized protein LOC111607635 [Xiphophorus maculatus]
MTFGHISIMRLFLILFLGVYTFENAPKSSEGLYNLAHSFQNYSWSMTLDQTIWTPSDFITHWYYFNQMPTDNLVHLMCLSVLRNCFMLNESSLIHLAQNRSNDLVSNVNGQWKRLILLLLLLSGNVQPNPGPIFNNFDTPEEFKTRSGLGILHINSCSLLPKIDLVKIWIETTNTDILVLTETWLNKSITNKDISLEGYNVFCCDRLKKGGGVAICVKNNFNVTLLSSVSIPKQFEFLALKIEFTKAQNITVIGCYRPPSAGCDALPNLYKYLADLNNNEFVLLGDLNLDWLTSSSDSLKTICDSLITPPDLIPNVL